MIYLTEAQRPEFIRVSFPSKEAKKYLKGDSDYEPWKQKLDADAVGEVLVDKENNKQIAHGFVRTDGDNNGFIINIHTHDEYRRMGFGEILIKDLVKDYGGVDLTVMCDNTPAVNLYKKCGFEIIDKGDFEGVGEEYYMKLKNRS